MIGKGLVAIDPFSLPLVMEESPWWGVAGELLGPWGRAHMVMGASPCSRPRPRLCPYTCKSNLPRPTSHQTHFVILPRFTNHVTGNSKDGDQQCGENAAVSACCGQKGTDRNCTRHRKQVASANNSEIPASTSPNHAGTSSSPNTVEACGECSWEFSVDLGDCDEVRAMTEDGVLTVEGRGKSGSSQRLVRHVTTLPPHVAQDALTASLSHGRLTVTQRAASHLPQVRVLPIDIQLEQKQPQDGVQQQEDQHQETQEQQEPQGQQQHAESAQYEEKSTA